MIKEIIELRKELHQNPELSGFEVNTAKRIKAFTKKQAPSSIIENIGGAGLMVIYEFDKTGPTLLFRCELDALPIQEANDFAHRSKIEGVAHKCGHDGHMAIIAGLSFWLKNQDFKKGKVILLFQPAEETGKGAYQMLNDPKFKAIQPDYFFSLHNIPGMPLKSIIAVPNYFSATVQSFKIELTGKEAHAAQPENGINPALGIAAMVQGFASLNIADPFSENFAILTPIHIHLGQKSYGISAGEGELHYTIRTWSEENMMQLKQRIEQLIAQNCAEQKLKYKVDWFEYFPTTINHAHCNNLIKEVAKEKEFELIEKAYPFKFGEDFGWFSKNTKAGMFGLGSGLHSPALHHADYDFPDQIIETGMEMFKGIIEKILTDAI
jgi:amidohydrolase